MTGDTLGKPGDTEAAHQSLYIEQFAAAEALHQVSSGLWPLWAFSAAQSPEAARPRHRTAAGFRRYHVLTPYFLKRLHAYTHAL